MPAPALPKAAEHAIKALVCLALSLGRPVPASHISRCVGIPRSQSAKILYYLSWRGLTRSRRGPRGGYLLREDPQQISVGQIIQLFQPSPDASADRARDPLARIWSEAAAQYERDWQQLTIAELARRTAAEWRCAECATAGAISASRNEKAVSEVPGSDS